MLIDIETKYQCCVLTEWSWMMSLLCLNIHLASLLSTAQEPGVWKGNTRSYNNYWNHGCTKPFFHILCTLSCVSSIWYIWSHADISSSRVLSRSLCTQNNRHWIKENPHMDEEIESKYSAWILTYDCVYVHTYVKRGRGG